MAGDHERLYTRSLEDPEGFWAEAAENVHWYRKWDTVLDDSRKPFYRWFKGGVVNSCYNALDVHVESGRADQLALIYDSPVTGTIRTFTYGELLEQVAGFAGVLCHQGVHKADRVIIYMPMVPEAVIAMLACARIGAVHSVVFGGFAPRELAIRIGDAKPELIVSASCGIEVNQVIPYKPLLDRAIEIASTKPKRTIILDRPQAPASMVAGRDLDWAELMANTEPVDCVPVAATDPLYILYTSGTTGIPKGEPPRDSRRLQFLRGWERWEDEVDIHLRFESVRCGWCWSTRASTSRSGPRWSRSRRRSAVRRRRYGNGSVRPSAMRGVVGD